MKKLIFLTISVLVIGLASPAVSSAQGMMGFSSSSPDNAAIQSQQQEEQEGKKFLDDLSNKTITCSQLKDADFEKIGEYFMGQAIRDTSRHIAMNGMMKSMMGEQGEEQMHIAMGKRMSDCEPNAPMPQNMTDNGMMSMMMNMMMGGGMMGSGNNSMMGNFATNPTNWFGWGFGWIFMILFWGLVILGIVALIKWIMNQGGHKTKGKSALEILKERYAKGEIDRKEFEDKKKDLS